MGGATPADWVTAIATLVYTVGSLVLWNLTRQSLAATRELFRLSLLVEYYRAQEPAPNVGHPWETREVPHAINAQREKQRDAMLRVFPALERLLKGDV